MTNHHARVHLKEIPSIDLRCPVGAEYARESVNYRPMPDGSVQKRCGYAHRVQLPAIPACVASVCRNGERRLMAVAGNRIYNLFPELGGYGAITGSLPSVPDEAMLFNYRDRLLLLDGSSIREVTDSGFDQVTGYAPLYGKDWHPKTGGEVYERRNLLCNRIRIHYRGVDRLQSLSLPSNVSSIARVEVNGVQITDYSKNAASKTIISSSFAVADCDIIVWYNLSDSLEDTELLNSCLMAEVVGSGEASVIFCSKCASSPHTVFRSAPVSKSSAEESRRGFSDADEFYFPESDVFSVGSDDLPVTALLSLDDRIIIYNSDEAWLVPSVSESIDPRLLCREVGCSSSGAAVICGELPAGLCGHSVYLWETDLEAYNELIAVCISDPVSSLITDELATRGKLITDRERRELWLFDPQGDESSPILVYNRDSRRWYTYRGPVLNQAFWHIGQLGGVNGSSIYLFSEELETDKPTYTSDNAISASLVSGWLDFGCPEELKLARRLSLKFEGSVSVTVEYEGGKSEELHFSASDAPRTVEKRLRKERFRQLRLAFADSSISGGRIYEAVIEADILQKTL